MFRKRIFTRRLAIYLYEHGCTILGTEPNPKNPDLLVWVFEDGTKLQNCMSEYMEKRRKEMGKSKQKKYIRFGQIPPNERSINFIRMPLWMNSDFTYDCRFDPVDAYARIPEEYLEPGVSVFYADQDGNPIVENEPQKRDLEFRKQENQPIYLCTGNEVGKGHDGEPLIRDIVILKEL